MELPNNKLIVTNLIQSIRDTVGEYLSTITVQGIEYPSVILDRTKGTMPNLPYIYVERVAPDSRNGSWKRHETTKYDEDSNKWDVISISEQTITYQITCLGDNSDDILTLLRLSYMDDIVRIKLNNTLDGAILQQFTDVEQKPVYLETDFIEGAVTAITFTNEVEFKSKDSSVIETIEGSAEIGYST